MRIVVVGGVAAGMSAASQAERRRPEAEVVVLERGPYIPYGGCGMPPNLEDPARSIEDLDVVDAESGRRERGRDVRLRHEVPREPLIAATVARKQLAKPATEAAGARGGRR
jgi:NADPH-dependent 2,4-dienoyl-CoA reductase/sulfur reductase-like enzyme